MNSAAPAVVIALLIPILASGETGGSVGGAKISAENDYEYLEARATRALRFFQQIRANKVFLQACRRAETRLWWRIFDSEHQVPFLRFSKDDASDSVLLDVGCTSGREQLEKFLFDKDKRPDGLPNIVLADSDSVELSSILRAYKLEGKFLGTGLVQITSPRYPEYPSVLRVALPDNVVVTDPVGALIARRMIAHLRESLNLTFSFRRGGVAELLSGNADLTAEAALVNDKTLGQVAVLGQQIWRLRTLVVMKSPGALWDSDALWISFTGDTWLAVGGCVLATAVALRFVAFFESRDALSPPEIKEEDSWSSSLITAVGMTCAQGFNSATSWSSARIVLVTYEVFSLFVGLFYSSAMVTFLLTLPEPKITAAADLVNWPLSIAVDPAYYSIPELLRSQDPIVRTVIGMKGESMSLWDALQVAVEEPIAFLSEEHLTLSAAGAALEVSNICRLQPVILQPDMPLFLMGLKSTISPWLQECFRRAMAHIAEIGLLSGDTRRAIAQPLICLQSDVTDTEAIASRAVWPASAILGVGHIVAVAMLFLEFGVRSWQRNRPQHSKAA